MKLIRLPLPLFCVLLAFGCSSDDDPDEGATGEPVKIGFIFPLDKEPGLQESYQLALKLINENGGVLDGRPLEFVARDSKSDPETITKVANELVVEDGIELVVGTFRSPGMAVLLQTTVDAGALVIAAGSGAESLTGAGDGLLLRFSPGGPTQRTALFEAFKAAGYSKIGISTNTTQGVSTALANGLETEWKASCGNDPCEVVREDYASSEPAKASDGSDELATVLSAEPDAFFVGSTAVETETLFAALMKDDSSRLIYTHRASTLEQFELLESGTVSQVRWPFQGPFDSDEAGRFTEDYEDAFGEAPVENAFAGFDAVMALAMGIEAAQSVDGKKVAAAMREITGPGGSSFEAFSEYSDAFDAIRDGDEIDLSGTSGTLDLDENGDAALPGNIWKWGIPCVKRRSSPRS